MALLMSALAPAQGLAASGTLLFLMTLAGAPMVAGVLDPYPQTALAGVVLLAGILHLAARLWSRCYERVATPVDLFLVLWLAASVGSVLFSVNRHASVVEVLRLLSCGVAFFLAADLTAGEADAPRSHLAQRRAREEQGSVAQSRRKSRVAPTRKRDLKRRASVAGSPSSAPLFLSPSRRLPLLWASLGVGAAWAAVVAVQEYIGAMRAGWGTWRSFGGFSNPNTLAGHLALTMPLLAAGALALHTRKDAWRSLWPIPSLLLLISGAGLAFTASRLGMACAGFGLMIFVLKMLAGRRRLTLWQAFGILVLLMLAGTALVFALPTLRHRLVAALSGAESFSLSFRLYTWQAALRIFAAYPLTGTGAGTFASIMTRYSETAYTQMAHNYLLQTASETGLFGFFGLSATLAIWIGTLVGFGKGDKRRPPTPPSTIRSNNPTEAPRYPERAFFTTAAVAGVLASAMHALLDVDWSVPATGWVLWALMGAGLGASGAARRVSMKASRLAVILGLLFLSWVPSCVLAIGAQHGARALLVQEQNPTLAIAEWEEALRLDPWWPDAHRELGRLLGMAGLLRGDAALVQQGEAHLVTATRLAPTASINFYHLGLLRMRQGRSQEAIATFGQALTWDPHNTFALRQLGTLYEESHWEETLKIARQLLAIEESPYARIRPLEQHEDPNYAFAHFWLGHEKEKEGDLASARGEYARAQQILAAYRQSLQGVGGFRPGGRRTEPEPDIVNLEHRVKRALARLPR